MRDWPHAPVHRLDEQGTYILTAGTHQKVKFFDSPEHLDFLHDNLLGLADCYGWRLQAWAVFANHYHFVAFSPPDAASLRTMISRLHTQTAKHMNLQDRTRGRRVWYQFWDSRINYQRSYLARLNYVHNNPVRHGRVSDATTYRWCSAGWFDRSASSAFQKVVASFKTDRLSVMDDF